MNKPHIYRKDKFWCVFVPACFLHAGFHGEYGPGQHYFWSFHKAASFAACFPEAIELEFSSLSWGFLEH